MRGPVSNTMPMKRVLVDFDGVLKQRDGRNALPIDGALGAMKGLKKLGYEIVIFTTRAIDGLDERQYVADWMAKNNIQYDSITDKKLPATYYIDDKAIAFKGDWQQTLAQVK